MKMRILSVAVLSVGLLAASCNGSSDKKQVVEAPQEEVETVEVFGTYEGILPAADCEGIKTILTVNSDSTYVLQSEYLGTNNGEFVASGVYNLLDGALIELITPSSGEKTYYKIVSDGVMLSDSLGSENQGELAKHYVLKKK